MWDLLSKTDEEKTKQKMNLYITAHHIIVGRCTENKGAITRIYKYLISKKTVVWFSLLKQKNKQNIKTKKKLFIRFLNKTVFFYYYMRQKRKWKMEKKKFKLKY